jgi:hypothetical protein
VTAGHRITLTYNLHLGPALQPAEPMDSASLRIESLPLYESVRLALADTTAIPGGSLIGFHCHHPYPRSRMNSIVAMETFLKGIDRALYMVLGWLGLQVTVRPVLSRNNVEDLMDEEGVSDEAFMYHSDAGPTRHAEEQPAWGPAFDVMLQEAADESRVPRLVCEEDDGPSDVLGQTHMSFNQRLNRIICSRRIKDLPAPKPRTTETDRIGSTFEVEMNESGYGEGQGLEEVRLPSRSNDFLTLVSSSCRDGSLFRASNGSIMPRTWSLRWPI